MPERVRTIAFDEERGAREQVVTKERASAVFAPLNQAPETQVKRHDRLQVQWDVPGCFRGAFMAGNRRLGKQGVIRQRRRTHLDHNG